MFDNMNSISYLHAKHKYIERHEMRRKTTTIRTVAAAAEHYYKSIETANCDMRHWDIRIADSDLLCHLNAAGSSLVSIPL